MKTYRINTADFRATEYRFDAKRKQSYCICEELIDGRWEGFVAIKRGFAGTNDRK